MSFDRPSTSNEIEMLKEYFAYCERRKELVWIKKRHGRGCKVGEIAGTLNKRPGGNYRVVTLGQKKLYAHRVIWQIHNGEIPKGMCIDHIDGNTTNNDIRNLRLATKSDNQRNSRIPKTNTSGEMCIHKAKNGHVVWVANRYRGTFTDLDDAIQLRNKLFKELGFHENHGRR